MIKAITLSVSVLLASSPVFAGGMSEPVMEPEVVVKETTGSSGGIIVPLLFLTLVAAVASNRS